MSLHSYQLKYIALITMIIDHFGVVFIHILPFTVYMILRGIGRLSFPIFCFLLVEGFSHTRDRNKYLCRLLLFALISELPFDLALHNTWALWPAGITAVMDWSAQNVFFTLSLGFLAMMILERYAYSNVTSLAVIIAFPLLGEFIHCDYGSVGVITIILIYLSQKKKTIPLWAAFLPLAFLSLSKRIQIVCILALLLIDRYNGEKGQGPRYLFYLAYPAHLLLFLAIKLAFY